MDATTLKTLITGLVLAAVAYFFGRLGRSRDRKSDKVLNAELVAIEEVKTRDMRIAQLERDVESLQARADAQSKAAIPIEAAMQAMLIAKLTNDHLPEADALLKKFTDGTLTADDAEKFAKAMKQRATDMDPRIGEAQRVSADLLAGVTRLKELREQAEKDSDCEVKTVMVTVPETETIPARDGGTQEQEKVN